ncbi:thiamine-phosphate kinase [bacterium]|nr:thiamine-phosphate kinase [bacterium]
MHRLCDFGEQDWLKRVRRWFASADRRLVLGIGDDAAAIDAGRGPVIATTDALIEGVHFRRDWIGARDLGRKTLAVNVSDIAAMGARPLAALLALSVPPSASASDLRDFFLGLRDGARRWDCPLAGGDLTRAPQWSIAITVLGVPSVRRSGRPVIVKRSTARPGQFLYVTGKPGESGAGLVALHRGIASPALVARHNRPEPRVREGELLARICPDLAMLDVSDGIWCDSGRVAEASNCAIEIESASLPVSRALAAFCNSLSIDPLDPVLFGGEDYELLFATAVAPAKIQQAFRRHGLKTAITPIGRVKSGRGRYLLDPSGRRINIADRTFQHFTR